MTVTGRILLSMTHRYRLSHWGRVAHICVSELTTIGSDNGLSPGRRQAIIWTSAGILWIGPLGTNFSENLIVHFVTASMCYLTFLLAVTWRNFASGRVNATVTLTSLLSVHFKLVKAIRYILSQIIYHTQVLFDSATNINSRSCHNRYPETRSYIYWRRSTLV